MKMFELQLDTEGKPWTRFKEVEILKVLEPGIDAENYRDKHSDLDVNTSKKLRTITDKAGQSTVLLSLMEVDLLTVDANKKIQMTGELKSGDEPANATRKDREDKMEKVNKARKAGDEIVLFSKGPSGKLQDGKNVTGQIDLSSFDKSTIKTAGTIDKKGEKRGFDYDLQLTSENMAKLTSDIYSKYEKNK